MLENLYLDGRGVPKTRKVCKPIDAQLRIAQRLGAIGGRDPSVVYRPSFGHVGAEVVQLGGSGVCGRCLRRTQSKACTE